MELRDRERGSLSQAEVRLLRQGGISQFVRRVCPMNFASQETATDYEGIVHQMQLMAQFVEELSQKVESEEERQLCHATAQEYRVSAQNYQQRIEHKEATAGEMGSHLNLFPAATA